MAIITYLAGFFLGYLIMPLDAYRSVGMPIIGLYLFISILLGILLSAHQLGITRQKQNHENLKTNTIQKQEKHSSRPNEVTITQLEEINELVEQLRSAHQSHLRSIVRFMHALIFAYCVLTIIGCSFIYNLLKSGWCVSTVSLLLGTITMLLLVIYNELWLKEGYFGGKK